MERMRPISEAVNIGPVLARELMTAGIRTIEQLEEMGSLAAWEQLRKVYPSRDSPGTLLALEGAVRGIRWSKLEPEVRSRLNSYAEAAKRA